MEDEKKAFGKVHVFSGERRQTERRTAEKRQMTENRQSETRQQENMHMDQLSAQRRIRRVETAQNTNTAQEMKRAEAAQSMRQNISQPGNDSAAGNIPPRRQARSSRYTDTAPVNIGKAAAPRRREQENDLKMQSLKSVLIVLVVILIAALIYEVVLGHGTKMTGSERMAEQEKAKQEMMLETESETAQEAETGDTAEGTTADENAADGESDGDTAEGMTDEVTAESDPVIL